LVKSQEKLSTIFLHDPLVLTLAIKYLVFPLVRLRLGQVNCLPHFNFHIYNINQNEANCKEKMLKLATFFDT